MNGDVLKKVFLIIVATLCFIVVVLTGALLFSGFKVDDYKQILEILGAPALLSMIITSFIHANIKETPAEEVIPSKPEQPKTGA